jgi:hypothetical protein
MASFEFPNSLYIILVLQESKGNWLTIKRNLQLVTEDTDTTKYATSWSCNLFFYNKII